MNGHHRQRAVVRLLGTRGAGIPEEGALIAATLHGLPTHRAYKALAAVAAAGVHNGRARAIAREFLATRRDLPFEVVKYRRLVRPVARHFHLHLPGELSGFLFEPLSRKRRFETPILERFRAARFSANAIFDLPFTIAEGLAARRGVSREDLLERAAHTLTQHERLRLQRASAGALDIDLGAVPLTRLALYLLSWREPERREQLARALAGLAASARRALGRAPVSFGRVAAVLDRSTSSAHSREARNRPLAVALGVDALLRASSAEYAGFWTGSDTPGDLAELLPTLRPGGSTNLTRPLLAALATRPDLVVIVSDGYENDLPGGAEGVARLYRRHLGNTRFVHVNPTFDGELLQPRPLAPDGPQGSVDLPTLGLRDAEDLPTALQVLHASPPWGGSAAMETLLVDRAERLLARHRARLARLPWIPEGGEG